MPSIANVSCIVLFSITAVIPHDKSQNILYRIHLLGGDFFLI